jgi:hypothetical protein
MVQDTVDDAGAVEPGQHRGPPGDCGRLEPPGLLHPADEQLQVRALRGQRLHATTPAHQVTNTCRSEQVCSLEIPLNRARYALTANRSGSADTTTEPALTGEVKVVMPRPSAPPEPHRNNPAAGPGSHSQMSAVRT